MFLIEQGSKCRIRNWIYANKIYNVIFYNPNLLALYIR